MPDETPRRRSADRDRRRWSDDRLDDLAAQVRALGADTGQLIRVEARLEGAVDDIADFKGWIHDVENRVRSDIARERQEREASEERQRQYTERVERACSALGTQLAAGLTTRLGARATIAVGAFAAAAAIIAAIITKGGGPT